MWDDLKINLKTSSDYNNTTQTVRNFDTPLASSFTGSETKRFISGKFKI